MFTIDDFVSKYGNYTDEELIEIYHNMADYREDANEVKDCNSKKRRFRRVGKTA